MKIEAPPLAHYRSRTLYRPQIGDFIVWSGWFSTVYGVVSGINGQILSAIWEGLPSLLFTLTEAEQQQKCENIALASIVGARPGAFSIQQHDTEHNTTIWYI